jgi:hypothetical protein
MSACSGSKETKSVLACNSFISGIQNKHIKLRLYETEASNFHEIVTHARKLEAAHSIVNSDSNDLTPNDDIVFATHSSPVQIPQAQNTIQRRLPNIQQDIPTNTNPFQNTARDRQPNTHQVSPTNTNPFQNTTRDHQTNTHQASPNNTNPFLRSNQRTCWTCGQPGHISRFCTQTPPSTHSSHMYNRYSNNYNNYPTDRQYRPEYRPRAQVHDQTRPHFNNQYNHQRPQQFFPAPQRQQFFPAPQRQQFFPAPQPPQQSFPAPQ